MDDLISRQEVIRLILERGLYCDTQADREISAEIIRQLPSAQPETHEERTETHSCDCISRQAAMEEISKQQTYKMFEGEDTLYLDANDVGSVLASLPSAQPNSCYTNCWCNNCKEYDTENKCCPRYNRVIKQTLDEVYAHAETEAEARFHDEIVRCKDCMYASKDDYTHCPYVTWWNSKDDFCSRGKRRTDGV